jgi:sulfate-transporting ATPase
MTEHPKVAIEARGLSAGHRSLTVVRTLDLKVHAGEVVALLGPNGAGKTTTMMTLAGALSPHAGQVLIGDQATRAPLHARIRRGIGLLTEQRGVIMGLTGAQNLRLAGCDSAAATDLFPELADHLDRRVGDLSGGQQQMLALARALGRDPSVLLTDELSLGLAPLVVDRLLAAVRASADRGVAVLVVEQHVAKILAIADRFVVLRHGEIALEGAAADYRRKVDEVYSCYFATSTVEA